MNNEQDVFSKLSDRMGAKGSKVYPKILANTLSKEEAEILWALNDWMTTDKLAKKLNMNETALQAKLDDLSKRRLVLGGKEGYAAPPNIRSFPARRDDEKGLQLQREFNLTGEYPRILVKGWENRLRLRGFHAHKVIPARQALNASPNLKKSQVLWYEDMEQILRKAKTRGQNGVTEDGKLTTKGCGCRKTWDACDYKGACTLWEWEHDDEVAQAATAMPGVGRKNISVEEALGYNDDMENQGMVHISPNTSQVTSTCNCCPCCCMVLHSFLNYGDVWNTLAPSRYRAVIDQEKCNGCQTCVERCHFSAIEMKKVPGSKKMKAYMVNEHCMGCGLCIFPCPNNAMHLEVVRPPEHIPTLPMSQITIVRSVNRPGGKLYDSLGMPIN